MHIGKQSAFENAQEAATSLLHQITFDYRRITPDMPEAHTSPAYQKAAIEHARAVEALEFQYTHRIYTVAAAITNASTAHWEKDDKILGLWQQMAQAVTLFSEHPTKKVATLIVTQAGVLEAFGVNRIPPGVAPRGSHYVEGIRKDYIVCSERMALSRLLGIEIATAHTAPRKHRLSQQAQRAIVKARIHQITRDIIEIGQGNPLLHDSYLITTASPCGACAHAIAPFQPRGLITTRAGGHDFSRLASIQAAKDYLNHAGIPITYMPA